MMLFPFHLEDLHFLCGVGHTAVRSSTPPSAALHRLTSPISPRLPQWLLGHHLLEMHPSGIGWCVLLSHSNQRTPQHKLVTL